MKPLPKAPLTEEDRIIIESLWHCLSGRERIHPLRYIQWESDRRDEGLMFHIEVCRKYESDHAEEFAQYGYGVRGWVHYALAMTLQGHRIGFTEHNILFCA